LTFRTSPAWQPQIFIDNDKHGNSASDDYDPISDQRFVLFNVGEPWAHLSNELSDALLANPIDPNSSEAFYYNDFLVSLQVHDASVWSCDTFWGAGAVADELFLYNGLVLPALNLRFGIAFDREVMACSPYGI
jgi:hypothetical protein